MLSVVGVAGSVLFAVEPFLKMHSVVRKADRLVSSGPKGRTLAFPPTTT